MTRKPMTQHSDGRIYRLHDRIGMNGRGPVLQEFPLYKLLVAEAQRLCVERGLPKTHWHRYFDWNV